jgi:hypothetical protein
MPSHFPHASHPSAFRAPGWGAPTLPCSCCRWRSVALWRSAPLIHRSASRIFVVQPGCIPSPMVAQDGDHRFDGGEKQVGLRPLPRPQLQGSSSSLLGRRARQGGACLGVGWRPASSSSFWGWKPSSSSAEEASSSHAGEGELLLPSQGAAFYPLSGRWSRRVRASHVQVFLAPIAVLEGFPARRTPRGRCSCSGAASARAGVRTCRCALGQPVPAGAVLADRWTPPSVLRWWQPEKVSLPTRLPTPPAPLDLRLPGLNGWFSSFVGESFSAAAFARKPLLQLSCRPGRRLLPLLSERAAVSRLEFVVPRASWYGGCSYPRERNRSPVCNGTLSDAVCSLWLSGPEHLCIWA